MITHRFMAHNPMTGEILSAISLPAMLKQIHRIGRAGHIIIIHDLLPDSLDKERRWEYRLTKHTMERVDCEKDRTSHTAY